MSSAYQEAQRVGQAALRTAILDAATRLLVIEGAAEFTVRRVAAEVGSSTKVIYTMFGGKDGLGEALFREGFVRLGRAQESVPLDPDPVAYVIALGTVYREFALAQPDYYRMMFEQAAPSCIRAPETVAAAEATLAKLRSAVDSCIDAGAFGRIDAGEVAEILWAAWHGAVSLELSGHFPQEGAAHRYERLVAAVVRAFRV